MCGVNVWSVRVICGCDVNVWSVMWSVRWSNVWSVRVICGVLG